MFHLQCITDGDDDYDNYDDYDDDDDDKVLNVKCSICSLNIRLASCVAQLCCVTNVTSLIINVSFDFTMNHGDDEDSNNDNNNKNNNNEYGGTDVELHAPLM